MKLRVLTFAVFGLMANRAVAADIFSDTCTSINDKKLHRIEAVSVDDTVGRGNHLQIVTKDRADDKTYILLAKRSIEDVGGNLLVLGEILSQDKANIRVDCGADGRSVQTVALFFKMRTGN
jgi:hypothetical protein